MSCYLLCKWTCDRCGKVCRDPFFVGYPREFWKDGKKRVGDVCEKCRDELDGIKRRRKGKKK